MSNHIRVLHATLSTVTSEGNMSKEESARLQAAVGTGKSSKLKAYFQLEGQQKEIDQTEVRGLNVAS